ncbi:MAG: beta-galactosidase [Kiritimatiellae bacterium]|nr:beta-galactosidase [Kiritimatiellia bacterium]
MAEKRLCHDELSLKVNGRRAFLVSGEFHYFRVPKEDCRRSLRQRGLQLVRPADVRRAPATAF